MTGPSLPSVKHRGWYTIGSGRRGIQGGTGGLEDGTRAIKGASIRGIHSRWVGTRRIAGGTRYKESSTKGTQSWGIARIIGSHRAQSLPLSEGNSLARDILRPGHLACQRFVLVCTNTWEWSSTIILSLRGDEYPFWYVHYHILVIKALANSAWMSESCILRSPSTLHTQLAHLLSSWATN